MILVSNDCKQWSVTPPVSTARILAVNVNANGLAYAVGGFGAVQKSVDWGKTWQPISIDWKAFTPDGAEPHLYDVHVSDAAEITIVGEFELILRSKDAHGTDASRAGRKPRIRHADTLRIRKSEYEGRARLSGGGGRINPPPRRIHCGEFLVRPKRQSL